MSNEPLTPEPERAARPMVDGVPAEVLEAQGNPNHRFGDYVLVRQVGWGGHGVVYRAWQKSLRRWVALKFLHVGDAVAMERFAREARVAAKLNHANIVPMYDVGDFEGRAFITMKLIDGETLDRARMEINKAVEVIASAADAVEHAHERGIIHRDLKPANMMLSREGHLYVMDFGLAQGSAGEARLTKTGVVNGTPSYMSPEHARGHMCDARSDVYSLGASLYELLGRRAPFEGAAPVIVLANVLNEEPEAIHHLNPSVTREMEGIVAKAMDKSPGRRYQTAGELAADLRHFLRGEPILARPIGHVPRAARWVNRHRLATAFISLLSVAVLAAVGASLFHAASMSRAQAHADRARRVAEEKLALSLISQGDALAAAGRLVSAASRFKDAQRVLGALGQSTLAADLGLMVVRQSGAVPLTTFRGHKAAITAVKFLPDGKRAVSASEDGTARLWEVTTGKTLSTFEVPSNKLWSLAVSPDGNLLSAGTSDGQINVWHVNSPKPIVSFKAHDSRVSSLVFSLDGRRLFSGGEDNTIREWDVASAKQLRLLAGHTGRVRGLALSHDGALLASAGGDATTRTWNLQSGKSSMFQHKAPLFAVRFTADDGAFLTAGQDGDLSAWSREGGVLGWVDANRSVVSDIAVSPAGNLVVSAGWDARTRIFGLPLQGPAWGEVETEGARVLSVDISPDGRLLINGDSEGHLRLFDLPGCSHPPPRRRDFDPVTVDFSRDGRLAATWQNRPHEALVWDVQTKKVLRRLPASGEVRRLSFAPHSLSLAVVTQNGEAAQWNLSTNEVTRWSTPPNPHSVMFAEDENTIWVGAEGQLVAHDLRTKVSRTIGSGSTALRLATSRDGRYLASAGRDGRLGVWNAKTNTLIHWYQTGSAITSVTFSRSGSRVYAGNSILGAQVIDLGTQKVVGVTQGLSTQVFGLGVAPDDNLLVTAGSDRTPRLWNAISGAEVRTLPLSAHHISSAMFTDDGRILVGEIDGAFSVWDPTVAVSFDRLAGAAEAARARIGAGRGAALDWHALGDWFASRGVCIEAVQSYDRGRSLGSVAPLPRYAQCLWSLGHAERAKQELHLAVEAGLLPASYAELLNQAPQTKDRTSAE